MNNPERFEEKEIFIFNNLLIYHLVYTIYRHTLFFSGESTGQNTEMDNYV